MYLYDRYHLKSMTKTLAKITKRLEVEVERKKNSIVWCFK